MCWSFTETVYGVRANAQELGDLMQSALDVRLGRRRAPKKKVVFQGLTKLPEPKEQAEAFLYEHDGREMTLAAWARESGIPKNTLWTRVVVQRIPLGEAIKMQKPRVKRKNACPRVVSSTNAVLLQRPHGPDGAHGTVEPLPSRSQNPAKSHPIRVSGDGIEPPTRGFSILCSTD